MGQESQNSAYLENFGRRSSLQGQSRLSEAYIKSSYMNDPPIKLTKEIPIQEGIQERKSANEPLTTDNLNKSPDLQTLRKRHQEHITQAFDELLKYKPEQDMTLSKREKENVKSYNNILKDIDECVNEMKKYTARGITAHEIRSKIDQEMIDVLEKKTPTEPLQESTFRENNFENKTQKISSYSMGMNQTEKLSNTLPKTQHIYEDQYKIGEFLPVKASNTNESLGRKISQENASQNQFSKTFDNRRNSIDANERKLFNEENHTKMFQPSLQELYREKMIRDMKIGEIENKFMNSQNERKDNLQESTRLGERNNQNLHEIISSNINKEQILSNSENIVETLSKVLVKVIQSNPNLLTQKVKIYNS